MALTIPLKHLKCSIMNIRFAMLRGTVNKQYEKLIGRFYGKNYSDTTIFEECYWLAQVLLTLRFESKEMSSWVFQLQENTLQVVKNDLDYVIEYLAITLPDIFSNLRTCLNLVLKLEKMNITEPSIQSLFNKLALKEQMIERYQLLKENALELNQVFYKPDAYFLYLLTKIDTFLEIYPISEIVEFLCSENFAAQNAPVESFDVHKIVFIAIITSEFKRMQESSLNNFITFVRNVPKRLLKADISSMDIKEMLLEAREFKNRFDIAKQSSSLTGIALKLDALASATKTIINILSMGLDQITDKETQTIHNIPTLRCQLVNIYSLSVYLRKLQTSCKNFKLYDFFLRNIINFNFKFKFSETKHTVCEIFDVYVNKTMKHLDFDSSENNSYCHECRLITCTISYSLNFVMHYKLNTALNNYIDFISHDLSNNFRVQMALKTALFYFHVWHYKRQSIDL